MKFAIVNLIVLLSFSAYSQTQVTPDDLKKIIGSWEGSLTYLDYQTNEPFTMPANLVVKEGKDESTLVLENIYPNEPKANNTSKIKIAKDGSELNKSKVIARKELSDGAIEIQTEYEGKDNNKKATIRQTYILSEEQFLTRKEVQFADSSKWIKRSEFSYQKRE